MNEVKVFFTALQFYTRIPGPPLVSYSEDNFIKATRYLPIVGWIVGSFCALILYISLFIFQDDVAILLSMVTGILFTGAFHEDGFADVCDGMGGGWTKERILEIMKDSRLGAYGAIGISLLLLLKFAAIRQISPDTRYTALICAHSLSRFAAVLVIQFNTYVRISNNAKTKFTIGKISNPSFILSLLFSLLPLFLFNNWYIVLIVIPIFLTQYFMSIYFKKWISGYTGDCLGAVQQVSEVICYLSVFVIYTYFKL